MGGLGHAPGHEGDHGLQDHGFASVGQLLVVVGGAPVLGDPGEGPLDDPAAGQYLEGVHDTPRPSQTADDKAARPEPEYQTLT
jgi:hypothetical protein